MAKDENSISTRERIWQVVLELGHANKAFSRQRVAAMTGLRYSVVDDHLERLRDDMKVVKLVAGTYELVREYPEFERISYTPLLDEGIMILEQGDTVIKLSFPALRLHVQMLAGFLQQHVRSEAEEEMRHTLAQIQNDNRQFRRAQAHTTRAIARLQRQAVGHQLEIPL